MTTTRVTESDSTPLAGHGALVTGGSRGIGRAVARRLAADGAAVVLTYATEQAAVEQVIRVASRELGPRGITANVISLGPTDTDLLRAGAPPEALEGAAAMTALGRIGEPADAADIIALLARPESRWITGQHIRADGGLT